MADVWVVGDAYEAYVGRWSRRVAVSFLDWLALPGGLRWLDAGCGTGALTSAVLGRTGPAEVVGVDPSEGFLTLARGAVEGARFELGDAQALPFADGRFDAVVSGLALNFVPDQARAVGEFARVAVPGATVAAYVWDYAGEMQLMRYFWDVAAELDAAAAQVEEGLRFPSCKPGPLRELWAGAGLVDVLVEAMDEPTVFRDFEDYWEPFLGGQGPAPAYAMGLAEERREELADALRARLPIAEDGTIPLIARAWAVKGRKA